MAAGIEQRPTEPGVTVHNSKTLKIFAERLRSEAGLVVAQRLVPPVDVVDVAALANVIAGTGWHKELLSWSTNAWNRRHRSPQVLDGLIIGENILHNRNQRTSGIIEILMPYPRPISIYLKDIALKTEKYIQFVSVTDISNRHTGICLTSLFKFPIVRLGLL